MKNNNTILCPLEEEDREQFIKDNQEAFNYGALEEFGKRDNHLEEDGQIISRATIEKSINEGETYRIVTDGKITGGLVLKINGAQGELDLLFVKPNAHSKGIGYEAWRQAEMLHPEVKVWKCVTPYFETRNIHFYVNRCGFRIVEFFNKFHPDPSNPKTSEETHDNWNEDGMFLFEKRMKEKWR